MRLPRSFLLRLIHDPHREVRIRVASRLSEQDLGVMIDDPDYYVRLMVAKHLPEHKLPLLIADEDPEVRRTVARRIPREWLGRMLLDSDPVVRMEVVDDPDSEVRRHARERLDESGPVHMIDFMGRNGNGHES
jgi:Mg/Co/Ni transporter MgtE